MDKNAYGVFILNISHTERIAPIKEIYHLDLNTGLYDGSPEKCSKNEIKQIAP